MEIAVTVVALLAGSAAFGQTQAPATSGAAPDIASRSVDKHGLGLSPEQSAMIAEVAKNEKPQGVGSGVPISIGAPIPDSMMLVELPIELKDRIGSLRDFKFARLQDQRVLLVDPTTRTVVDVIGK